jgi:hypothetical protein
LRCHQHIEATSNCAQFDKRSQPDDVTHSGIWTNPQGLAINELTCVKIRGCLLTSQIGAASRSDAQQWSIDEGHVVRFANVDGA